MAGRAAWVLVGLLWAVAVLNYRDRQLLVNVAAPERSNTCSPDGFTMTPGGDLSLWLV